MNVEHVSIGDDITHPSTEPKEFSGHDIVKNRLNGTVTEIRYSREGYLRTHETRKGTTNDGLLLELRFLDPTPILVRRWPVAFLWSSLAFGLLAMSASFFISKSGYSQHADLITAALSIMAILSLVLFAYRYVVDYQFRTASGEAIVLTLSGTFESTRRMQKVANRVSNAIVHARKQVDTQDENYLRAEIQAHYRLANTGAITREACTTGNFLILSKLG